MTSLQDRARAARAASAVVHDFRASVAGSIEPAVHAALAAAPRLDLDSAIRIAEAAGATYGQNRPYWELD